MDFPISLSTNAIMDLRYHAIHIKTADASSTQTVPMPAEDIDAIC
jgi:hypothetical protein